MTNSKLRNSDSAYLMCLVKFLLKLFTFLISTTNIELYNIYQWFFYSPITTIRTSTHTHKSNFNHKDKLVVMNLRTLYNGFIFLIVIRTQYVHRMAKQID